MKHAPFHYKNLHFSPAGPWLEHFQASRPIKVNLAPTFRTPHLKISGDYRQYYQCQNDNFSSWSAMF